MRIILFLVTALACLAITPVHPYVMIVIDPGHGGPGASKFGLNGDGVGTAGPAPDRMSEQWVNLQVAQRAMNLVENDWLSAAAVLTRTEETQSRTLAQRVQIAKDNWADYFVSIHHGGSADPDEQFSEVFWSNRSEAVWLDPNDPDSVFIRSSESRDSLLAKKILLRIRSAWNYLDHCRELDTLHHMRNCDESQPNIGDLFVLNRTHSCRCALS